MRVTVRFQILSSDYGIMAGMNQSLIDRAQIEQFVADWQRTTGPRRPSRLGPDLGAAVSVHALNLINTHSQRAAVAWFNGFTEGLAQHPHPAMRALAPQIGHDYPAVERPESSWIFSGGVLLYDDGTLWRADATDPKGRAAFTAYYQRHQALFRPLASDPEWEVRAAFTAMLNDDPQNDPDLRRALLADEEWQVRCAAYEHKLHRGLYPEMSPLTDADERVRMWGAARSRFTTVGDVERLLQDPIPEIRAAVLCNLRAGSEHVTVGVTDPSHLVRLAAVLNRHISADQLAALSQDPDDRVASAARVAMLGKITGTLPSA
jgi:hypothetical protein